VRQIEERVAAIEKKRGIKTDDNNDKGKNWPSISARE